MKQTAVQELLQWVRATMPMDLDTPQMIETKIQSLLEKEKQQIINAVEWDYKSNMGEVYYESMYGGKDV
jgi:hypothetical protein